VLCSACKRDAHPNAPVQAQARFAVKQKIPQPHLWNCGAKLTIKDETWVLRKNDVKRFILFF
jgi:hypothetical protein